MRSGTGDIFAAVIAADCVNGHPLENSVKKAAAFVRDCILAIGKERYPADRMGFVLKTFCIVSKSEERWKTYGRLSCIIGKIAKTVLEDRKDHRENPYAFSDADIVRRAPAHDIANLWRPAFVRDIEKILHNPYYNRYSDKTQVLSAYQNDDISRRALHVQLVARIARNIGRMLGLNEDLIEAISLGHDIGHTPFGHAGERFLNELYHAHTAGFSP